MSTLFQRSKHGFLAILSIFILLTSCTNTTPPATPVSPSIPIPVTHRVDWAETVQSPISLYESQGLATDGRLYVFGGYFNEQIQATTDTFAFDPGEKRWSSLAPLPEPLTHAGQAEYNGKIYLAGGFLGDHPGPATDHVWIYDIATNGWSQGPSIPEKLGGGALVELDGRLHFFGGTQREGQIYIRDSPGHWVLDLQAGSSSWQEAAPLPDPRNHIAGAAVGGRVYAIGGQHLDQEETGNLKIVHAYDPALDRWQRVADLPQPLGHISAGTFAYKGRIIVTMGVTQGPRNVSDIIAYNPKTDVWERLTPMRGGRSSAVAGVIDGQIVLSTGRSSGLPLDTTWIGTWLP